MNVDLSLLDGHWDFTSTHGAITCHKGFGLVKGSMLSSTGEVGRFVVSCVVGMLQRTVIVGLDLIRNYGI